MSADSFDTADRIRFQQDMAAAIAGYSKSVLAVDFDDTLTVGDGHEGVAALVELRHRGYAVIIHTANADFDGIRSWLRARWPTDTPIPPVTERKPQCAAYIDDKAYRFRNWQQTLVDFP